MKRNKLLALGTILILLVISCTTYQKMGLTGGYSDYPLGAKKYKVSARGNGYTSEDRVQSIAFKRAAALTLENGYKYFYILDDQGNTTSDYVLWANRSGTNIYNVRRHSFDMIIQMTENDDGINAQELFDKYSNLN
jgi:hypothetical protein